MAQGINYRQVARNAGFAFFSQLLATCVSILTSLIVPKILGITEFGYWQLFIFYASYVGLFGLGAIDGLYLIYGGKTRSEIDHQDIASQYWFSVCYVALFSLVFAVVGCGFVSESDRALVLLLTSIYSLFSQMSAGLGYIFQAMNETKTYSKSTLLDRGFFATALLVLVIARVTTFFPYVVAYIIGKLICTLYCVYKAYPILKCRLYPPVLAAKRTLGSIKVGFGLMIASVADLMVLGVARQIIDMTWGIEVFGRVSLALSMSNFIITFVYQASMVLFPALRQGSHDELISFYKGIKVLMGVGFPLAYVLYYPIVFILVKWLPQYSTSFQYFALLLPVCVYNSRMDICCTTYFKVLRQERLLLRLNLVAMVSSALLCGVSLMVFHSVEVVLISAVIVVICRSIWSEWYLDKRMNVGHTSMLLSELILTAVFVWSSWFLNRQLAPGICLLAYLGYIAIYHREAQSIVRSVFRLLSE